MNLGFEDHTIFSILNDDQAAQIKQMYNQSLSSDYEIVHSLIPKYREYGLRQEAIVRLEGLLNNARQERVIYSLLAEFYEQVGLVDRAIEYSKKAAEQAAATNNFIMAGFNLERLANIYLRMGEIEKAREEFKKAEELYEKGQKSDRVEQVRRRLDQLRF